MVLYNLNLNDVVLIIKTNLEIVASSILVIAAIQLLAWFLSSYWNKGNNLLMAKNFPSTKRKSSFYTRKITDFVTPSKLVLALLSYGVTFILVFYIAFEERWFENSNKALLLGAVNLQG